MDKDDENEKEDKSIMMMLLVSYWISDLPRIWASIEQAPTTNRFKLLRYISLQIMSFASYHKYIY